MKVAVICEFSGIVRDAFIRAGHDATSFDLLMSESSFGPHVQDDVGLIDYDYWEQFDLAICHPPCTYLSNAGAKHLYRHHVLNEERYNLGMKAKEFFMYLYTLPIEKIAVENPIPSKIYELPEKTQVIQPYYFGHPFLKTTYLWLKNLPLLIPTKMLDKPESTRVAGNWFNHGGKDRQKNRSRTFPGIAEAMAKQWGDLV